MDKQELTLPLETYKKIICLLAEIMQLIYNAVPNDVHKEIAGIILSILKVACKDIPSFKDDKE